MWDLSLIVFSFVSFLQLKSKLSLYYEDILSWDSRSRKRKESWLLWVQGIKASNDRKEPHWIVFGLNTVWFVLPHSPLTNCLQMSPSHFDLSPLHSGIFSTLRTSEISSFFLLPSSLRCRSVIGHILKVTWHFSGLNCLSEGCHTTCALSFLYCHSESWGAETVPWPCSSALWIFICHCLEVRNSHYAVLDLLK